MKYLLPFLISLLFMANANASSITVTGKVSGTWNVDTVFVAGDLKISADTSLVIMPATRVIFQGHFEVWVQGVIRANGNAGNPIVFTVADTTGFADTLSTAGGWHGFLFNQPDASVDSSYFSFCRFEYGKAVASDTTGVYGGALRIFNWNKIVISDCDFYHNLAHKWGGAIYAKYADIAINRTIFRENRCGTPNLPYGYGGAFSSVHSNPVVEQCLFENNSSTGLGGGACFEYSDPVLRHNIFRQNFSGLGGGFAYIRCSPSRVASNNLVNDNVALFFGGGVAIIRCNVILSNNTIVNNQSSYGGGFYANDSACPGNYNTILYGNSAGLGQEVYIWDVRSAPSFYYSNVAGGVEGFEGSGGQQGYHGTYENNFDTVPGFAGTADHPFSLLNTSPMIDRGTPDTASLQLPEKDLGGNNRVFNNRIDIGAYEWNNTTGMISRDENDLQVRISPNPVRTAFSVTFTTGRAGTYLLSIFTHDGKPVWHSDAKFYPSGEQTVWVTIRETGLDQRNNGYYLLQIKGDTKKTTIPFLVLR